MYMPSIPKEEIIIMYIMLYFFTFMNALNSTVITGHPTRLMSSLRHSENQNNEEEEVIMNHEAVNNGEYG